MLREGTAEGHLQDLWQNWAVHEALDRPMQENLSKGLEEMIMSCKIAAGPMVVPFFYLFTLILGVKRSCLQQQSSKPG